MLDDSDAAERLQRALDAVQHPTGPAGSVDAHTVRHLLAEYTATVHRLRATVRDAEARLRGVADDLRTGARVVRRERARVDPPQQPGEH